jgi:CARDB
MHFIGRLHLQRGLLLALLFAGLMAAGRRSAHAETLTTSSTQAQGTSILPACVFCVPMDLTLVDLGPTTATATLQTTPLNGTYPAAHLIDVRYNGGLPQQYVKNLEVWAIAGVWQASSSSLLTIPLLGAGGHVTVTLTGWAGTTSNVTVDPNNAFSETNETNNTITVKFS